MWVLGMDGNRVVRGEEKYGKPTLLCWTIEYIIYFYYPRRNTLIE